MNEKQLAEILKFSSPNTIYIVTWDNLLKLLFCPFEVMVRHPIGDLLEGERVLVDAVKVTADLRTVFMVKGRAYFYYHFKIVEP